MILVWAIFTLMLFVLEPLVLHRLFRARAARDPDGTFTFIQSMHWVLLLLSLIAVAGAVAGSHGWAS
jgi:peptidoglycan biosynthesis protein MviN/MurJ (putative lipid II flippase)